MLEELKKWQAVMFETKVPQLMLSYISVSCPNKVLPNRALQLVNLLLSHSGIADQRCILQLLKHNDTFFEVFMYIKERLEVCKAFILSRVEHTRSESNQYSAEATDPLSGSRGNPGLRTGKPAPDFSANEFTKQTIYMKDDFDVEKKYEDQLSSWKEDEVYDLLDFISHVCDNCFTEAQLYLGQQLEKRETNLKDVSRGKITSVDLVSEVVQTFIEIVDSLGSYVFSDQRTYRLLPRLLETII